MTSKPFQIGAILSVMVTSLLLLAFIFGVIDQNQLQNTLGKILLSIVVIVLTSVVISAIANIGKK